MCWVCFLYLSKEMHKNPNKRVCEFINHKKRWINYVTNKSFTLFFNNSCTTMNHNPWMVRIYRNTQLRLWAGLPLWSLRLHIISCLSPRQNFIRMTFENRWFCTLLSVMLFTPCSQYYTVRGINLSIQTTSERKQKRIFTICMILHFMLEVWGDFMHENWVYGARKLCWWGVASMQVLYICSLVA